jgi:hypothetical protein
LANKDTQHGSHSPPTVNEFSFPVPFEECWVLA